MRKYYNLAKKQLFPLCRSLTGKGTRETLNIIKKNFPALKIKKIKSGKKVFDWKIPSEWNIKNAFVLDKFNNKVIDFKKNNLHVVGYSMPINKKLKKKQLLKKIFSLKNQPTAIPYVTSYYNKSWGFCLCHNQKKALEKKYNINDYFRVVIDSSFNNNGNLHYGELILKGNSKKEIFVSTYICHPSMANNELSGPIVSMGLINFFQKKPLKKTIRFIFIPETIGSIAYLNKNLDHLKKNVIGGYNLSCLGDERNHSCLLSKNEDSPSDKALLEAYKKLKIKKYKIYSFLKRGSDERQYNSPGIDLPISSIFRSKYGTYPEYHTSLDDFKLMTLKGISGGFKVAKEAINFLLKKNIPKLKILCEPFMTKYNLYPSLSIKKNNHLSKKYMDFLQYADGKNTIESISKKINISLKQTNKIFKILKSKNIVD